MTKLATASIVCILGVAIAGCTSTLQQTSGANATTTTPAANTATTATGSSASASSSSASPSTSAAKTSDFGADTGFVYTDGLVISVLGATTFTPSDTAAGTVGGDTAIKLTIRVKNGTKKTFDPSIVQVAVHAGTNGDQGSPVTDIGGPAGNIGMGFEGSIPAGQAATAVFGFDVPTPDLPSITVIVTPDFSHADATLTGDVQKG